MDPKHEVIEWLRDAYAMERSREIFLEEMAKNDRYTIPCRTAAAMHLTETHQHAQSVESMLRSVGSDVSSFKTGLGLTAEAMKAPGAALSHDVPIKDLLTAYSMEHFEIACYEAIVAVADLAGLSQISNACKQIMQDEIRMAEVIQRELPRIVEESFSADAATPKAA